MFMKMSGRSVVQIFYAFVLSLQGHMQREKKTCRFGPPKCLEDMSIMFERSWVSGLSACVGTLKTGYPRIQALSQDKEHDVHSRAAT
jgi:hypothetical protein